MALLRTRPSWPTCLRLRPQAALRWRSPSLRSVSTSAAERASGAEYDVIVVGGGHNGLISAAYLAKAGLRTLVLEKRAIIGGAATTEEIVPGFRGSRFSYLAGLLRPVIISELELHRHGLEYLPRSPSSFTPPPADASDSRSLVLGAGEAADRASIAQFSEADAAAFPLYEAMLSDCRELLAPLLDAPPPNPFDTTAPWSERVRAVGTLLSVARRAASRPGSVLALYELLTAPASRVLDRWFESEVLKATLATDAVIGAQISPHHPGSAYVLLHLVMGESAGRPGVWSYVRGGMGAISASIASAAVEAGAEIVTDAAVARVVVEPASGGGEQRATGVQLTDGTTLGARLAVLSNATPMRTFTELVADGQLPAEFVRHVKAADYTCGAFKINLALSGLPNFACAPNDPSGLPGPQHRGTIHFEASIDEMDAAYREASLGVPAAKPVIEMCIPTSLDGSLAPQGQHVAQLFVQYAPYKVDPTLGSWADPAFKEAFVQRVIDEVERYAPGFASLIVGVDALSPLDLERLVGLHEGNIFHSALALHQLAYARPVPGWSSYRGPLRGLYLCGSGAHPGGGVMGAPGRNAAQALLRDVSALRRS